MFLRVYVPPPHPILVGGECLTNPPTSWPGGLSPPAFPSIPGDTQREQQANMEKDWMALAGLLLLGF